MTECWIGCRAGRPETWFDCRQPTAEDTSCLRCHFKSGSGVQQNSCSKSKAGGSLIHSTHFPLQKTFRISGVKFRLAHERTQGKINIQAGNLWLCALYFIFLTAEKINRLATGWTIRGSNPGGGEILRTGPDRICVPPSLLYSRYLVIPRVKLTVRDVNHQNQLSVNVKEREDLYLHSPSWPLWQSIG
jgi:hypothetical protein